MNELVERVPKGPLLYVFLGWVNGHPQYVLDHDLIAIPLAGWRVAAIRIVPVASGDPWSLGDVLLHPVPAQGAADWDEWIGTGASC